MLCMHRQKAVANKMFIASRSILIDKAGWVTQHLMASAKQKTMGPTRRPDLALERKYGGRIAGIDEAGRGPWAGPVIAAAVIFKTKPPSGINDSKCLTPEIREALFNKILACAEVGVGIASVEMIDEINIYHATHAAMRDAVGKLKIAPAAVLVDGNRCPKLDVAAEALVDGDALSVSVAAAS